MCLYFGLYKTWRSYNHNIILKTVTLKFTTINYHRVPLIMIRGKSHLIPLAFSLTLCFHAARLCVDVSTHVTCYVFNTPYFTLIVKYVLDDNTRGCKHVTVFIITCRWWMIVCLHDSLLVQNSIATAKLSGPADCNGCSPVSTSTYKTKLPLLLRRQPV